VKTITYDDVKEAGTCGGHGGIAFNTGQFQLLGIEWQPRRGWIKRLIGLQIEDELWEKVREYKRLKRRIKSVKVPSPKKTPYQNYLRTDHWKNLRQAAFERDGFRCTKCGNPYSLCGHHIRYRSHLTECVIGDIQTLCKGCHNGIHNRDVTGKKLPKKRKTPKRIRRLRYLIMNFDAT
jgi:5-methylcytosine-specific restriction endonuclease McrA